MLLGPFYQLNGGGGQWDIKINMQERIGEGIVLCGSGGCAWVDYSTPGNIHFGFMAGVLSVPELLSQAAGGYLEIKDGTAELENWETLFENSQDWAAVQFGYDLFESFGADMTVTEFQKALTVETMKTFQPPPPSFPVPGLAQPQINHYPPKYFNYYQ
jgi:hypothetical protein